jgi:hypothetical protein
MWYCSIKKRYFEILKPGISQEDLKALFPGLTFCPNVLSAEPYHCHTLVKWPLAGSDCCLP